MNKLIFKVNGPKDGNLAPLIKEITRIECRIYLDVENGFVTVENVNDALIDAVIDLINTYYILLGVEIDNIVEEERVVLSVEEFPPETPAETAAEEPLAQCSETDVAEVTFEDSSETAEPHEEVPAKEEVVEIEPQSPEDLIIKKVEFQNPAIENAVNKLLRTAFWAMYKQNGDEKEIINYIWTSIREMSYKYNPSQIIDFSFGDIVDCYYGTHLPREINGSHVLGIVADISAEGLVYIVPITKSTSDIVSASFITFYADKDVEYYSANYIGGTALVDKARYIRAERLQSVVGKAKPEFIAQVIDKISSTFDFRKNLIPASCEVMPDDSDLPFTLTPETPAEAQSEPEAPTTAAAGDSPAVAEESAPKQKAQTGEDVLILVVGDALKAIDPGASVLKNVKSFMEAIGMPTDNPAVNEAFVAATDIKKINYENIIAAVQRANPSATEDEIKNSLKDAFKAWISSKEELAGYPRLAFTSLLKLFAKAVRA